MFHRNLIVLSHRLNDTSSRKMPKLQFRHSFRIVRCFGDSLGMSLPSCRSISSFLNNLMGAAKFCLIVTIQDGCTTLAPLTPNLIYHKEPRTQTNKLCVKVNYRVTVMWTLAELRGTLRTQNGERRTLAEVMPGKAFKYAEIWASPFPKRSVIIFCWSTLA